MIKTTPSHSHEPYVPSALCLSGGGIRSATFSLGVLQALAKIGWLGRFTYLSTVSGGGYIGSWLTSWIRNSSKSNVDGVDVVIDQLASSVTKGQPEPPEIKRLRAYSNYLSPRNGISADFLTLVSTFLRNLLLNWLVVIPLIAGIVLVPMLSIALFASVPKSGSEPLLIAAALCGIVAIAYATSDVPRKNKHQTRTNRFKLFWLWPMLLSCVLLAAALRPIVDSWPVTLFPSAWSLSAARCEITAAAAVVGGMLIHVLGVVFGLWFRGFRSLHGPPIQPGGDWLKAFRQRARLGWSGIRWRGLTWAALSGAAAGFLVWVFAFLLQRYLTETAEPIFLSASFRRLVFDTFAVPAFLMCFQLGTAIYVGFIGNDDDDGPREWWGRAGGYAIFVAVGWIFSYVLVAWLPASIVHLKTTMASLGGIGGAGGMLALIGGYFGKNTSHNASESVKSIWRRIADNGLIIGAGLFVLALLIFAAMGWVFIRRAVTGDLISKPDDYLAVLSSGWIFWGTALIASAAWVTLIGTRIGSNTFSMQSLYGNRLIRAYLGSTRRAVDRKPHAFTDFDPDDDMPLSNADSARPKRRQRRLQHVINVALNISRPSQDQLDWQQRKAALFTFTSEACGSEALAPGGAAFVDTAQYAGISLGTAMSLSGAAASPNMGYHTSSLVAFVLTFFNVRLGAWLPNPRLRTTRPKLMGRRQPRVAVSTLIAELVGRANTQNPFVYLSDGGHFENLGLYEMVRRKCKRIVVVDASCDDQYEFEDLEASIRMIHTDIGARIDFPMGLPTPEYARRTGMHFVVGRIDYGADQGKGELIYIKPVLSEDESVDVARYAARSRNTGGKFPHDPTSDQFFDESQFESYRSLGYHSVSASAFPDWNEDASFDREVALEKREPGTPVHAGEIPREMPGWVKEIFPVARSAARGTGKAFVDMSIPAWAALLALPVTGAGSYWLTSKAETFVAFAPPAAAASVIDVAMFEQISLRPEEYRKITLPVFSEACTRGNTSKECEVGAYARTPDPAATKIIQGIANFLYTECASGGPVQFSIHGYSSSSDFENDSIEKNVVLADQRAWEVTKILDAQFKQLGEQPASGGAQNIERPVYTFEPRFCGTTDEYKDLCKETFANEPADARAARLSDAATLLQQERVPDRDEAQSTKQLRNQGYYLGAAQLNRRVELRFQQLGSCTIRDIWESVYALPQGPDRDRGPRSATVARELTAPG